VTDTPPPGLSVPTFLRQFPRSVGKDVFFEGVQMKNGGMAMLRLPVADLDPEEFPDSDTTPN
jgi:cytochrome P450